MRLKTHPCRKPIDAGFMDNDSIEKEKMMIKGIIRYPLIALLSAMLISACATPNNPLPGFDPQQIDRAGYDTKVDNLVFVLDASNSMAEGYQHVEKLDIARGVINNFNTTMPDVGVTVALRSFGHADAVSSKPSDLLLPAQAYSQADLTSAVDKAHTAGGSSPLGRALKDVAADLKAVAGPTALVIVSDGKEMAPGTLAAAQVLQTEHPDQLCIYTVQVGDDVPGGMLLREIAGVTVCGDSLSAAQLDSGQAMNAFVKNVLLTAKNDSDGDGVADDKDHCPDTPADGAVDAVGCPLDSDKDGVVDYKDACPGTPLGTKVDAKGCPIPAPAPAATESAEVTPVGTWLYKDIQFETNKADLRDSSTPTLNEIAEALKAQPALNIEIQGHTDSTGSRNYNMGLSQRRAESVKAYLESVGIDTGRMTTRGYGLDRPIDTNSTKEGRARNRRVEVKPMQ
jgi:OOP family OmpA-OmpF porin